MKKAILMGGAGLLAVGFITLTGFGAKTKAEQEAEIAKAVTDRIEAFRAEKAAECDTRVAVEAKARYDATLAAAPVEPAKPGVAAKPKPKPKKGTTTGGPKVDPLPQPTAPPPVDPKKAKTAGETPAPNTEAKQSKTAGEAPAPNTDKKKAKTAGGGGN